MDLSNTTSDQLALKLQAGIDARHGQEDSAAVLVPLVPTANGFDVVLEVRALTLKHQPGEVCVPGGVRENGESALQAAVRETCEELLIDADRITVIGDLGRIAGLGDFRVRAFVGVLDGYQGTFLADEVDRICTVPLSWFLENEPTVYRSNLVSEAPDDFPWDLIPHGRDYPFRRETHKTYFYHGTDPLIWGFTAHVLSDLADSLKASEL